jgi:hypothetical protein
MTTEAKVPAAISVEELQETLASIENEPRPQESPAPTPVSTSPLQLREFVSAPQLKRDVAFELHDLDNAIRMQAGLYVHYADLARQARRQHDRMKVTAEVMESRLYATHREAVITAGGKPTKDQVEALVRTDPRWYAAQQKVIDAKAIMDLAVDSREALHQRKDMLVQVSVDRRREREGELRIGGGAVSPHAQDARDGVLAHLQSQREGTRQ